VTRRLTTPTAGHRMSLIMQATHSILLLTLALAAAVGCSSRTAVKEPEGYRVLSHDTKTGEWVILRNGTFDGKYLVKRITAVCDFYRWGNREMVKGPDSCDLRVGAMIVPNQFVKDGNEFVDVYEMSPEHMAITKGQGENRVSQQLTILKYEVLPE
jgi:hypothetical protein